MCASHVGLKTSTDGKGFVWPTGPFLLKMCEVIIYGDSEYEKYNEGWSAEDKRNALAHLKALKSFEFAYVLITLQRPLI